MGSAKKAVKKVTGGSKPKAPEVKAPKPIAPVAEVTRENGSNGSNAMGFGGGAGSSYGGRDTGNILDPISASNDEEKEILG